MVKMWSQIVMPTFPMSLFYKIISQIKEFTKTKKRKEMERKKWREIKTMGRRDKGLK